MKVLLEIPESGANLLIMQLTKSQKETLEMLTMGARVVTIPTAFFQLTSCVIVHGGLAKQWSIGKRGASHIEDKGRSDYFGF